MQVFVYSLQNTEEPWAAIEARLLAEQQAADAARYPEQLRHNSPLGPGGLSSREHAGGGVPAARTAYARLSEQFQPSRPATASELIAGLPLHAPAEDEPQQRQSAEPAVYGGSARQPNGHSQAGAAALGVFADCSSCDEEDMDMLQAAMDAEAKLGNQHGIADASQAHHAYLDHQIASEEDILQAPGGYTAPDTAMLLEGQPTEEGVPSWQGDLYEGAPDIIFEGNDLDCLQAEAQPAFAAQPEGSMRLAAPLARSSSSGAEGADAQDWHTASPVRSGGPFAKGASDDFIFCDDQEEGDHTDKPPGLAHQHSMHSSYVPQPLHGTGHASLAENSFGTTPGGLQHYAFPEIAQQNGQSLISYAELSAHVQNVDTGDEDIQMATDQVAHPSRASSLKSDKAVALSEPADVLIATDSQELNMQPEVVTDQTEEEHGRQAQAEWGAENDDSQEIIFDDAAIEFAAQWMHAADSNELDDYIDTPMDPEQQQAPGSSVATETRRKRTREELRDKLIQVRAHQLISILTVHTQCSNIHKLRPERVLCIIAARYPLRLVYGHCRIRIATALAGPTGPA